FAHRRHHGRFSGMWTLVKYLYAPRGGVFPGIAREWFGFFRPNFHPWDYDNRRYLGELDSLLAKIDETNARSP
ncbi:metal-dependent hydrolase, partial [Burkholderia gladioli]